MISTARRRVIRRLSTLRSSFNKSEVESCLNLDELLSDDLTENERSLVEKINDQDWVSFLHFLKNSKLGAINDKLRRVDEFNGSSVLQIVLRNDPPFAIVSKLTQDLPDMLFQKDHHGRTPLHVAIECHASRFVVGHLSKNYPQACNLKDKEGKTPLHRSVDGIRSGTNFDLAVHVVEILVDASPSSLDDEDDIGMCPLELAIMLEAPLGVINLLQAVNRRYHRSGSIDISSDKAPRRRSSSASAA